jgi:hypothetical protein
MLVPADIRARVIRRVYADADRLGWDSLPASARSDQYDAWVSDPAVGGMLAGFLEKGRVRTWLKDNPMKHYANAKHGVGSYAAYADSTGPTPSRVADAALGRGWQVVDSSVREKPLRFFAQRGEAMAAVAYGPSRKFRDLLWAALNDAVDPGAPTRSFVVIVDDHVSPTSESDRVQQRLLSDRCGIELRWISFAARVASVGR